MQPATLSVLLGIVRRLPKKQPCSKCGNLAGFELEFFQNTSRALQELERLVMTSNTLTLDITSIEDSIWEEALENQRQGVYTQYEYAVACPDELVFLYGDSHGLSHGMLNSRTGTQTYVMFNTVASNGDLGGCYISPEVEDLDAIIRAINLPENQPR